MVTFLEPFPLRVKKDHLPRPRGSSPLPTIRETQFSQITVAVPPDWNWDKKSSGGREWTEEEVRQMLWRRVMNMAHCSERFQLMLVSGRHKAAAPYCLLSQKSCKRLKLLWNRCSPLGFVKRFETFVVDQCLAGSGPRSHYELKVINE